MAEDPFASMIAGLESAGLSHTEIAERAGLSRATVWRLANGQSREPGWGTIQKLRSLHERVAGGAPGPRYETR